MALVGQHQQTAFSDPQAGQSPIAAAVVRNNDNANRASHNAHDADATIHVQTGLLANRPAAGTAFAMYLDENARLYLDNGSTWAEVPYARLTATSNTFTGDVAVEGDLAVDGATSLGATQAATLDVLANPTVNGGPIPQAAIANLTSDLAGKAAASHTHAATDITSGTLSADRLPTAMGSRQFTGLAVTDGGGISFPQITGTNNLIAFEAGYTNPSLGFPGPDFSFGCPINSPSIGWIRCIGPSGGSAYIPFIY